MTNVRGSSTGKVHLVGAGPGDPELLTLKAAAVLRGADLILHDDLVPPAILALAGARTMLVNVGKRCGAKRITQAEINKLMAESAGRGMNVVRLKSGDPGDFGRLAEELDALAAAGIEPEIVPGVTAAAAAAASLGASLTDRRSSSRLLIVSWHHAKGVGSTTRHSANEPGETIESADWRAIVADGTTIAVYMPGHEFAALRKGLLEAGIDAGTPAVIVSRASTPEQQHYRTTIAGLDAVPELRAPTMLLIGKTLERVGEGISLFADPEALPKSNELRGSSQKENPKGERSMTL